uniref:uncharacterized protein LOC122591425 n=1 Tax=Erigeron canadensis TaxID=72917 RepID=UPI001CB95C74|nr:uncharacterized protein LOC122591425 [Erigeron canadensis]
MDQIYWMYEIPRATKDYLTCLNQFIETVEKYKIESGDNHIRCPCKKCKNIKDVNDKNVLKDHLICEGFTEMYTCWIYHGEYLDDQDMVQPDYNENDNSVSDNENSGDNLNGILHDVEEEVVDRDFEKFQKLFDEAETSLYPGSKVTKLSVVYRLFNFKAGYGWSDRSFTELLKFMHEILPKKNNIPISTYKAKKFMCPLGFKIERINACPNDCILYRNEYADLDQCFRCGTSRYKQKNQTGGDINGMKDGTSAKTLWYLPIIPRLKRLFANSNDAKLLRWHVEERKIDRKIRHVADSSQWRNIDIQFEEFSEEIRAVIIALGQSFYAFTIFHHGYV